MVGNFAAERLGDENGVTANAGPHRPALRVGG